MSMQCPQPPSRLQQRLHGDGLLAAMNTGPKLVQKVIALMEANSLASTKDTMRRTHPALDAAIPRVWTYISKHAGEIAQIPNLNSKVEAVLKILWVIVDKAIGTSVVELAHETFKLVQSHRENDENKSLDHVIAEHCVQNPKAAQLAHVWKDVSEIEQLLSLRSRYVVTLLSESALVTRPAEKGDVHVLDEDTRAFLGKCTQVLEQCAEEVAATDCTKFECVSWQAAWGSILQKAHRLAQEQIFKPRTEKDWSKESNLLHMKLNALSVNTLKEKIAERDRDIDTHNMSKPKLIASIIELAIGDLKTKESELAQDWQERLSTLVDSIVDEDDASRAQSSDEIKSVLGEESGATTASSSS